ncbi:MAG: UDP-3-O-(3-hydroxymyristoyl)glucosamine N-acyltransferase [Verrucomicrobiota bacterium]
MKETASSLATEFGGKLVGNGEVTVTGFASLDSAAKSDVSFFASEKFLEAYLATSAGVVLVPDSVEVPHPDGVTLIKVPNPAQTFEGIARRTAVLPAPFSAGIEAGALVAESANVDSSAQIQAGAIVAAGACVGAGTVVLGGAVIQEGASVGANCRIGSNVVVGYGCEIGDGVIVHGGTVIGSDGFGFEFQAGRHEKLDQVGKVRIEDLVEIGSNCSIDRARFGETVIGEGTKIDNLVQIAHNVVIGKHCIIVAQAGIAGSTKIGNYVTVAAKAGIAGHLKIADQVTIAGDAGVISNIEEVGETYMGYPAKPFKECRREAMRIKQLGGLLKRIKALEQKLKSL